MIVEVDPDSYVPPYEQIRHQIATMIDSGVLPPAARLPSIRQLAGDLGLAANTVARSYRELEATGVIVTRVGNGTTVAKSGATLSQAEKNRRLRAAADAYLAAARRLGSTAEQAIDTLRQEIGRA